MSSNIDKLSLQLLANKGSYKKYVASTNPDAYQKMMEQKMKIDKYKYKIRDLFATLLENPDKQITNDVNETFNEFMQVCVKYFETKQLEKECNYGDMEKDPDYDDAYMFDTREKKRDSEGSESEAEGEDNASETSDAGVDIDEIVDNKEWAKKPPAKSCWGPSIKKNTGGGCGGGSHNLDGPMTVERFFLRKRK